MATPEYVDRNGAPGSLAELDQHLVVKQVSGAWGQTNQFSLADKRVTYTLPERFVVNSPNAARNPGGRGDRAYCGLSGEGYDLGRTLGAHNARLRNPGTTDLCRVCAQEFYACKG